MKFNTVMLRLGAVAAIAMAVPSSAQAQLWYNGNFDGVNGLTSERNTLVGQAMVYDNFVVTGAGWTINSVFGNFLSDIAWSTADFEIRTGVSSGNGGSIVASGSGLAATQVATGRSGFGYTEYTATISGLSIFLNPGTYWLGISPVGNGTGRAYLSTTSGAGGSNANIDAFAYLNSSTFGVVFGLTSDPGISNSLNYSYGVDGASTGQEVVPEPATMTLLATGLAGMAAARRRKAAQA